jgi:TolA-binding protein
VAAGTSTNRPEAPAGPSILPVPDTATDEPIITGLAIKDAERALQAAKQARLSEDLVRGLHESVIALRRAAELQRPHAERLQAARQRTDDLEKELAQVKERILKLEGKQEDLEMKIAEAIKYEEELEAASEPARRAARKAPDAEVLKELISDLATHCALPDDVARILLERIQAPPTPPGAGPPGADPEASWTAIRAALHRNRDPDASRTRPSITTPTIGPRDQDDPIETTTPSPQNITR